jgi:hypothetical protein
LSAAFFVPVWAVAKNVCAHSAAVSSEVWNLGTLAVATLKTLGAGNHSALHSYAQQLSRC